VESEKSKRKFKIFIVVALGGSLMMNFMLLSKINWLDNQLNHVSDQQQTILHSVDEQTSEIQLALDTFKEEQSWLGPIHMDVQSKAVREGQAEVRFKWQVKEWKTGSEVSFNYAIGRNEEYETIPAEELQTGLFQAKVPIEIHLEPLWEVALIKSNSNMEEMSQQELEEKQLLQNSLRYFVSVASEDVVKSGEVQSESFDYLGTEYYGIIQGDIHLRKKDASVTLMQLQTSGKTFGIEEAYLLKYKNDQFIGEEEIMLDDENGQFRMFHLTEIDQYEDQMRFVIKVVYPDGATFERKVR